MTEKEKEKAFEEMIKNFDIVETLTTEGKEIIKCGVRQLQKEVEKKDKTILKMAKAMNNFDIDEDICKQMGQKKYCSEYEEESECEKCIIEYFEKKEG